MARLAYVLSVVTLLGASVVTGVGIEERDEIASAGVGFVLLTSLQRS